MRKLGHACRVVQVIAAGADGLLQPEEQAVEIDRYDLRRVDGGERAPIGEPARAEIPTALSRGPHIAIKLLRNTAAAAGEFRVLPIRLIARQIRVIPIAIQYGSICQGDDAAMRGAGFKTRLALHPKSMLAPQLRQVARVSRRRILRIQQSNHREEKRWL